ncbi:MAG: tryptophan synthase subunit beta [Planctomycetota bacterium]
MAAATTTSTRRGYFGRFGGTFVPETLVSALDQLDAAYQEAKVDPAFNAELATHLRDFAGRPTLLVPADRLSDEVGGARIWLKREDLLHTGAHKINNTIGQALLAKRMGKTRLIAETGAGQHGVATATAAAKFGLPCDVYMGSEDVRRQSLNVFRMRLLGANVIEVDSGSRTLKDATNEAMRDWMGSSGETHYILGSVVGPHPFPAMVRDFHRCIGDESRRQFMEHNGGDLPEAVVACVGGGSNAAGMFAAFIDDDGVRIIGTEAGGRGSGAGDHAAPLTYGEPGVLHGSLSYVLQDPDGQTRPVHSASAGLDYPGVGPEHAFWKDEGRVEYEAVSDTDALDAFQRLARTEGILCALETAHAFASAERLAREIGPGGNVLVCCSGRGDKDCQEIARLLG